MKKIVLVDHRRVKNKQDDLFNFLYGLGLTEYTKSESPLIVKVMEIFLKNKTKILTYQDIIKQLNIKDKDPRTHVVKICKRLSKLNFLEETALLPRKKKRWERAYVFNEFDFALKKIRRDAEEMLDHLTELSKKITGED